MFGIERKMVRKWYMRGYFMKLRKYQIFVWISFQNFENDSKDFLLKNSDI